MNIALLPERSPTKLDGPLSPQAGRRSFRGRSALSPLAYRRRMANAGEGAAQIRIARPTDRLDEVVAFYKDGLGLEEIGGFADHDGYTGVMLGLPGRDLHLEFTTHADGSPGAAPSRDNLLVFYLGDAEGRDAVAAQLEALGGTPVAAENPFWDSVGALTFEDPDGWRVVLVPGPGI
jgi:catechol 2,3-dioxygenase-like lactoylglutathione lyase family enzyme